MSKEKSNIKTKDNRTRNWSFLVYPDSAPENWQSIIEEYHIQWIQGPLHDKDINPDGTPKKPHWHVILMYEGNKSFDQIKEITDKLNSTIPQKISSVKGLTRYLAHLDNPDKAQYNPSDIIGYGGVDLAELLKPTSSDRYASIREMLAYIKEHNITEMADMLEYAATERFEDWFPLLCDNSAYIIGQAIKSYRHKRYSTSVDIETGEILE